MSTIISRLKNVLEGKPFDIDRLASLVEEKDFRNELCNDDTAWSALDEICDFLDNTDIELDLVNELLCFLATRSNPREFVVALSERFIKARNNSIWFSLLRPMAISLKKYIIARPADATVEDAFHAVISSRLLFSSNKFADDVDEEEVSQSCASTVSKFVDEFFDRPFQDEQFRMYSVATCLCVAATPLSCVSRSTEAWGIATSKLIDVVTRYTGAFAILEDLTDVSYRHDRFLGQYFFNNMSGRWSHLKAGLGCLLAADHFRFALPLVLEPRYRFFISANVVGDMLAEISPTSNPDLEGNANVFQTLLACDLAMNLLTSIPADSFNSECISSIPSFMLVTRRIFSNLTGSPISPLTHSTGSSEKVVKVIDEMMRCSDSGGKWQLIWMWVNQVPADNHPAGPVRALAIDRCRYMMVYSVKNHDNMIQEKLAKLLPMVLRLSIARENVQDSQPGLLRVDTAISVLSFIQFVLCLTVDEKPLLDEQLFKTLGLWLEHEFRPAFSATRNFLEGTGNGSSSNMNPWLMFSSQLLARLDIIACRLPRVEELYEQKNN